MTKACVIMAGGTGGHVFPGIAVAERLRAHGWDIHWLGNHQKMEAKVVPAQGFYFHGLQMTGLRSRGLKGRLSAMMQATGALVQSIRLLQQIKPRFVLGFGGYVSGPGGVAAKLLGIPLLIHEQNAVAGMANRWLARCAERVLLGFPAAASFFPNPKKCFAVGNPVRENIVTVMPKQTSLAPLRILVVGGSLGAQVFNQQLPGLLSALDSITVWHQTGTADYPMVLEAYRHQHIDARVAPFIDDMAAAYAWADVVICRAGALTVSELAGAGKPAVLVPYPHAVDDHQRKNAEFMVAQGAAQLVLQHQLNEQLPPLLRSWQQQPQLWLAMGQAAKAASNPEATARVLEHCFQVVGE